MRVGGAQILGRSYGALRQEMAETPVGGRKPDQAVGGGVRLYSVLLRRPREALCLQSVSFHDLPDHRNENLDPAEREKQLLWGAFIRLRRSCTFAGCGPLLSSRKRLSTRTSWIR